MADKIDIPNGWTTFMYGDLVVVEWPKHGAVTISEKSRGYAIGIGGYITARPDIYNGRGWKLKLYADGIKALRRIYDGRP